MIDRATSPRNRSAIDMSAVIPWTNESGETIPAYGVVQLRTDYSSGSQASKPDGTEGLFFVNGMVSVAAEAKGESRVWSLPQAVLLEGSLHVGDEVGPVSDQWYMDTSGTGFRVLLQPNGDGVGVVVQVGGGGGAKTIAFAIVSSDPTVRSALVEIRQRTFIGTVYASELEDTIVRVYDTDGCYLNEPNVDLTGRLGKATLMKVDDEARDTHFWGDSYPPEWYWNVISVCCPSAICDQADS